MKLLACCVLALAFAGVAAASEPVPTLYTSSSEKLAPTAKEIGFQNVLQAVKAKKPSGLSGLGWRNGVAVIYQKGGTKNPTEAATTISVYSNAARAQAAWRRGCSKCKTQSAPAGLKMKAEAGTGNGQLTLHELTRCANILLDVVEANPGNATALDTDVAKITNAVFSRAHASGLKSCSA